LQPHREHDGRRKQQIAGAGYDIPFRCCCLSFG
jgi:hypothetical protein